MSDDYWQQKHGSNRCCKAGSLDHIAHKKKATAPLKQLQRLSTCALIRNEKENLKSLETDNSKLNSMYTSRCLSTCTTVNTSNPLQVRRNRQMSKTRSRDGNKNRFLGTVLASKHEMTRDNHSQVASEWDRSEGRYKCCPYLRSRGAVGVSVIVIESPSKLCRQYTREA